MSFNLVLQVVRHIAQRNKLSDPSLITNVFDISIVLYIWRELMLGTSQH